ncbi:MAG: DNA repair protein RecN [Methylococcaceae bacterium]|nr:DNA repair protein RecN [Methylococcaceae bacterium]
MLTHLTIKDLAVVESLSLELERGLIVLTGETGAGKSILMNALGLALGDRADSGLIRPGADKAEINLEFDLDDAPEAAAWLADNELTDEGGLCLVRRVVSQDGRSRAFINNRPATLQALQELASKLVEIHGQHAHLHLLQNQEQRRLLDESAGNGEALAELQSIYRDWRAASEELERLRKSAADGAAREELLRFQIDELEQHDIERLDYQELSEEQTLQANVGRILTTGQSQIELLYDDERHSVNASLHQAINGLEDIARLVPELAELPQQLREAQILVKDVTHELRRQLDRLEADPARLTWLDDTLGDFHRLARKHHTAPQELKAHLTGLRRELDGLEHSSETIAQLENRCEQLLQRYRAAATALSQRRETAAQTLQERITGLIRELGMPQGQFRVELSAEPASPPSAHGWDRIEFTVSANPGLPPRPLSKVASGGELSRLSLAIQVAATDSKSVATLVFDEVDTGIGGGVAEIVGQKLRTVAGGRQVFCITHLHQVAAQGHHHLLVEKTADGGKTRTGVRRLEPDERIREIARMLGGVKITESTLTHAEELLAAARES